MIFSFHDLTFLFYDLISLFSQQTLILPDLSFSVHVLVVLSTHQPFYVTHLAFVFSHQPLYFTHLPFYVSHLPFYVSHLAFFCIDPKFFFDDIKKPLNSQNIPFPHQILPLAQYMDTKAFSRGMVLGQVRKNFLKYFLALSRQILFFDLLILFITY
ncbi:MAG TPA: hypothetical protein DCX89_03355 [Saprospirales bacterium]|nr:hypothetical protein [Saprospirales bacterium]HAY70902.1 hypothetical protein [Saprospirales bacterium]